MPRIEQVVTFSDGITCLHATPEGLWIGHQGGVSFLDPRQGASCKWTTAHGIPALPVLHIESEGKRLALGTSNGVAWTADRQALVATAIQEPEAARWCRALTHTAGDGAYINGVAFVGGQIYAATGGGRLYLEKDDCFEVLELPIPQARLLRILPLTSPAGTRRLVLATNNSGVLVLATGGDEEPSLYQWGTDEGLCSRYVTAAAACADWVAVGVHGGAYVAAASELVARPATTKWLNLVFPGVESTEHLRIHALCEHQDALHIGTANGLYRVSLGQLARHGAAAHDEPIVASHIDETPVRHLASLGGQIWGAQYSGLGHYLEGSPALRGFALSSGTSHTARAAATQYGRLPRITRFNRRLRFISETRWRRSSQEPESREILALASTPEGLVLGGECGRVALRVGQRWISESITRTRRAPEVHSIAYDPDSESFWVATRHGLFQRDRRGRWARDAAFPGRTVHDLCVWNGVLIAIGSAGLHVFSQGEWRPVPLGEESPTLFSSTIGPDGLTLVGRPGGGFYHWRPQDVAPMPLDVPMGRANCMAWSDDGALWLGSERGLARWDGQRVTRLSWPDARENQITALLYYEGQLHVGSHAGVWVAPAAALADNEVTVAECGQRLGLLEGIPHAHVTNLVVHDGQVWVATRGGVALLH